MGSAPSDEAASDIGLYRLPGEDAPLWLAGGFAALGLAMALAATYLIAGPQTVPPRRAPAPVAKLRPAATPPAGASPGQTSSVPRDDAGATIREKSKSGEAVCLPVVSVAFAYNSAQPILEGAQAQLAPLLEWLEAHPEATLVVEGHADRKGREAYNVMLSYSRAQAVIAWLVKLGLDRRQLTPLAAGAAQPKNPALSIADNRMALLQVEGVAVCQTEGAKGR